ncbi:MAG: anaerobic ribonucleoside-triphosphate reductase activating protein [Methanomicrobiales archaeon]
MIIGGTAISSLDYPGKISFVIFCGGCVIKCPYCHNPEIIDGGESVKVEDILKEIEESIQFIDGVVITGGEALIQYKDVQKILEYCKDHELLTKIDTNGCFPDRIEKIIHLIDYVGLDIKAPFNKYKDIIGSDIADKVKKTMKICLNTPDTFLECKTTYVPTLMDKDDVLKIALEINCDLYTIQQFRNRIVLDKSLSNVPNPTRDELLEIALEVKPYQKNIKIKTSEFGEEMIKKEN